MCVLLLGLGACTPQTGHKVLSVFFDGVPPLGEEPKSKRIKKKSPQEPAKQREEEKEEEKVVEASARAPAAKGAPEPKRPLIESLKEWEAVLKALPKDPMGGADWIAAIKAGTIAPRAGLGGSPSIKLPFTLDTLVQGISRNGNAPFNLDVALVPDKLPLFKVVFPHNSHTLWLNCSSCHPGIVRAHGEMSKIFKGEYCGACHGKVSFEPRTGCPRCHVNLAPADKETVEEDLAKGRKNPVPASPEAIARGKAVYREACAVCHGEKGDGKGTLDPWLQPKARDFTAGKYKFRTTPSSLPPTDYDIFRTITLGAIGTTMPAWSKLPYEDRWALVHYVKSFSQRFEKEKPSKVIAISDPPPATPQLLKDGKLMYTEAGCNSCHGDKMDGNGPSAKDLKDDWGNSLPPYNFTGGQFPRGGTSIKDVYRAVMTGLQGTPMPDFGEVFEDVKQAWSVVSYVYSVIKESTSRGFGLQGIIDFKRTAVSRSAALNKFPLADSEEMPPAKFPHWLHRVRFKCSACHPALFEMKAGANKITMDEILGGKFCGSCHNGKVAWLVSFENCHLCHIRPESK